MKAVILVGGEGTRLQPLTLDMPKPMVPVLNQPFLEHTVAHLQRYQVEDIILALGYLPQVIQAYLGKRDDTGARLTYTIESAPLGTAGAVKNIGRQLVSTFAVLNGDTFSDINVADMLAFHRRQGAKGTIALTCVGNPSAFGVVETDRDGKVRRFVEKPSPDQVATNWINAGFYILEPEVLQNVPLGHHYMFEKELFPLLLRQGEPLYGYSCNGYWMDMGTPEKYLQLNCDLLLGKAKSALIDGLGKNEVRCAEGVSVHSSAQITGPAIIGNRCTIGPAVHIRGPVAIGPNSIIDDGAEIERTVLWEGVHIGAGAILKGCVLGSNTAVDDNARLTNCVVPGNNVGKENADVPSKGQIHRQP